MPYACSAYGGRVDAHALARGVLSHLRPARGAALHGVLADQSQRLPHLAAAPLRSRLRRQRVDWLSVVEAASEQTTGRAWVENGRLRMRMNQYWSRDVGPDDDPCPRWRRHGPYGDDCAGRGLAASRFGRGDAAWLRAGLRPAHPLCRHGSAADTGRPARRRRRRRARADQHGRRASSRHAMCPRVDMPREPGERPIAKEPLAKDSSGRGLGRPRRPAHHRVRPSRRRDPPRRPRRPPITAQAEQVKPKPPRAAAGRGSRRSRNIVRRVGTGSIVPKIINRPAAEPTSSGHGMVSKPTTPYVEKAPEPAPTKVAEAKPSIEPAATAKPSTTSSAKPSTVSEPAPGNSTFTALTPSATTQALVGFAGLVAIALGLFAWTRHREQLSLAAAGGREFGSVNFEKGDAKPGVWSRGSALPRPQPARATPPQTKAAATRRRAGPAHAPGGLRGVGREPRCRRGGHPKDCRRPASKLASRPRHRRGGPSAARAAHDADQCCLGDSVRQASPRLSVARRACGNAIFSDPNPHEPRCRSIPSQVATLLALTLRARRIRSVNRNHIL